MTGSTLAIVVTEIARRIASNLTLRARRVVTARSVSRCPQDGLHVLWHSCPRTSRAALMRAWTGSVSPVPRSLDDHLSKCICRHGDR